MYYPSIVVDARGSRRRYLGWAFLAVLMLTVAAVAATDPFGAGPSADERPLSTAERAAERVERRLARSPQSARLLRATTQAWINAGNQRISKLSSGAGPGAGPIREDFKAGFRAWNRYLRRMGGDVGGDIAELVGGAYFHLLEIGSRDLGEIEANAAGAARALTIAGRHKPTLFTLSNTAIYDYFNGEFAAGDRAAEGAAANVTFHKRLVVGQLNGYRERAEFFRGQVRRAAQELQETGEDLLEEPLKAYSSSAELNQDNPAN